MTGIIKILFLLNKKSLAWTEIYGYHFASVFMADYDFEMIDFMK